MRLFFILAAAGVVLLGCESHTNTHTADTPSPVFRGGRTFVTGTRLLKSEKAFPGRYIVVLDDKATLKAPAQRVASELATLHGAEVEHVYTNGLSGFVATMTEDSARRLSLEPGVKYVEEDGLAMASAEQAGPPWNLDRIDQRGLPLNAVYSYGRTGSGVHVYILDTGLYGIHSEFLGRTSRDYDAVPDWPTTELDCHGHGTHMAGIIGGRTYGVAKGVELHSIRTLGCDGAGYWSDFIEGISWVNANHIKPAVINISATGVTSEAFDEAIIRSIQDYGITFVVSAGHADYGGTNACGRSPGRVPAAITVSAIDSTDTRLSGNYGSCVDLFAPGHDIVSAGRSGTASTRVMSGSSTAAAHVAGAVALYLEANPTATPEQVTQTLLASTTPGAVWDPGPDSPNRLLYTPCGVNEATAPPQITLTAPSAGAALSGTVTLAAAATDDVGVTKVEFYHGAHLLGTDTSPPYELEWDTATASNGPGTLSARAYDATCGLTNSAAVEVTIQNAGNADFDPQWQVPACTTVGSRCDSVWLLEGRGQLGPEPHAPNTLGGTCGDGAASQRFFTPALDRLAVFRSDGTAFAPGKEVTIEATVRSSPTTTRHLELYSAPDASNPTWTLIKSLRASGTRHQVLSATFLLPQGGLQAIRGVFRTTESAMTCDTSSYHVTDHDDLVFAVGQETDSVPPTAAITSPAAGATVERTVTIGVAASDNFGVARVELYGMDGTLMSTDSAPPFSLPWNTKGLPNGPYSLTVRAYDAAGLSTTSEPVEFIINNDLVPPQVAFLSPQEGEVVNRNILLRASASDDRGGYVRVEYFRSLPPSTYSSMGSSSTPPYSVYWDTRNVANGPRALYAMAYDADGNSTLSEPLNVVIDNDYTKPTVAITSPTAGAAVSGAVSIEAAASDDRGISSVYFYVDGRFVGVSTSAPYSAVWDSTIETNGSYTLTATAYDLQGNSTTSAALTVTVNNAGGAAYDPLLRAPACTTAVDYCDSGRQLRLKGSNEANAPNTLDGCTDGVQRTYPHAMGIDRIRVARADGTALAVGKRVRIDVEVYVYDETLESVDLYYTSDAGQPSWTYITTLRPSQRGSQVLSVEYRLPEGSLQAVRVNHQSRWQPAPASPCSHGDEDDRDDLVFAVTHEPDTTAPSAVLTSPGPGAVLTGMATATATASDDFDVTRVEFYEGTTLLGTDDTAPYSVTWNSWYTPNGSRTLTAVARDAAGNAGPSSPVTVEVYNDHAALLTTITSPTAGAIVTGAVTISATPADASKVRSLQFLVGTRVIGTDYTYPYSVTWETLAEPIGEHSLTAIARDAAGNTEPSAPVTVTVARDTTPPSVTITAPAAGATVSGVVQVTSHATDDMAIGRVELYVNGSWKTTVTDAPYTAGWDTRPLENGSYTLMLKAFDSSGNVGTSSEVTVTVENDKIAPTVSVTSPTNGATVSGTVTFTANATDNQSIKYLSFHLDGVLLGYDSSAPYTLSWNSRSVANGAHTLTVKAYDYTPNEGTSAPITFTVDNDYTAPTVALTSPAPGATVAGMVSLQADASDAHGVTQVEFFVGTTRIATVTAPPYAASWDSHSVMNGSYSLSAKAYDAAGNSSTSAAVTVSVAQPGSAVYDATLRVPVCAEISSVCDSTALLKGRGPYAGPEPHYPNTLDGCADGTNGTSLPEQIRWIRVSNADGAPFATHRRVRVDVAVEAGSNPSYDFLDLYFTGDATAPSWTYLATLQPGASGLQVLSAEYVLPAGSLQAVRANFRYGGSGPSPCTAGYYNDHDDLAFAVDAPVDVTPPSAAITSPTSGALLGGAVTVTATAEDDFSVERVEFYDGQTLLGTDSSAPYGLSWNTVGAAEGAHTLTVKAYDSAGHVGTSAELPVIVDNTAPAVAFSAPAHAALIRGTVQVSATASDSQGVSRVEFYDGTVLIGTATTAPYAVSWDTTASPNGGRTLWAKAYDAAGNVQEAWRSVNVDNAAPTVAITSPQSGAKVGLSVTIHASASDNTAVTQVVFYDGTKVIGTDTSAPYSVNWGTLLVPKGQHTLTAKAYDSAGNVTTSAGVVVTVQ